MGITKLTCNIKCTLGIYITPIHIPSSDLLLFPTQTHYLPGYKTEKGAQLYTLILKHPLRIFPYLELHWEPGHPEASWVVLKKLLNLLNQPLGYWKTLLRNRRRPQLGKEGLGGA